MNKLGSIFEEIPSGKLELSLASAGERQTIFRQFKLGTIMDQGDDPICIGCATRGLMLAEPIKQDPFSAKEIYTAARKKGNTPKNVDGAKLTSAIDFLKEEGVIKQDFWSNKPDSLLSYLFTTSPIVLSLPWSTKLDTPAKDGRCKPGGDIYGFHAVLAYSYDALKNRVWLANSWGREFGREGCFYLTEKDFGAIMKRGGLGVAVTE